MFAMKRKSKGGKKKSAPTLLAPRRTASGRRKAGATWWAPWRKWGRGNKARSWRYWRQEAANVGLAMAFGISLLIVATLWASGVFGQAGEEVSRLTARFLAQSGLAVEQVSVSGRTFTDKAGLTRVLAVDRGMSILHYDLDAARARVEALDWVDQASINRLWPDAIHVDINERRPIAIWQLNREFMLIDQSGDVIASNHLSDFSALPHVVGNGAATAAADLIKLLDGFPLIRSRVRAAIRVGGRRWNLRLDSGLDIKLPDTGEAPALRLLTELEKRHRLFARDIKSVDLRVPERLFLELRSQGVVEIDESGLKT